MKRINIFLLIIIVVLISSFGFVFFEYKAQYKELEEDYNTLQVYAYILKEDVEALGDVLIDNRLKCNDFDTLSTKSYEDSYIGEIVINKEADTIIRCLHTEPLILIWMDFDRDSLVKEVSVTDMGLLDKEMISKYVPKDIH